MESDRFICAREDQAAKKEVIIVDLTDANQLIRRPISAESAIMHPTDKIIALRAQRQLQIFNMQVSSVLRFCPAACLSIGSRLTWLAPRCLLNSEAKQKVKSHLMHEVSL